MSKKAKLIKRFYARPKDFTWSEVIAVMEIHGFYLEKKGKTSGSARRFVNHNTMRVLNLHEPHPAKTVKPYVLKLIMEVINNNANIQ